MCIETMDYSGTATPQESDNTPCVTVLLWLRYNGESQMENIKA